jgi:two-component system, OmpR family, KDP operon response regulator KdpE
VKKRILVVDDEPAIARVLRVKFTLAGYDVISTTSGAEAIEMVRTNQPDIMLLDVMMPDVTGLDVLEGVRGFSRVPIIVFTGRQDMIRFARKLGANDFIGKPFDPDQLIEKCRLILAGSEGVQKNGADQK